MRKRTRSAVLPALVISTILAGPAFGQAFDFAFDLNTPAADSPKYSRQAPIDVDAGLGWSFGYFGKSAFAEGGALRLGLLLGRQSMKVGTVGGYPKYNYTAFRIQGRGDIRLWANRNFHLSGGLAAGLTFLSDNIPCNEFFCGLPSSVVEITPNLRITGRISDTFSLFLDARGSVYLSDHDSTFPFTSGAILSVGVEIAAYVGDKSSEGDEE